MYRKISVIGKIIGYFICSLTIDGIDLTDSFVLNWFIISPIISWCLIKISYYTCNVIVYRKLNINEPSICSVGYWTAYYVYVFITFGVLYILKLNEFIPVYTNFDLKVFNGIVNLFNNILTHTMQHIVTIL